MTALLRPVASLSTSSLVDRTGQLPRGVSIGASTMVTAPTVDPGPMGLSGPPVVTIRIEHPQPAGTHQ
jgi:hypothetical protein